MQTTTTEPIIMKIPGEVQAFADERGLAPHLPKILEALHRVFAEANRLTVEIQDDPEDADLRCILFEADVPWSKEQWRVGMKTWYHETAAVCPAPLRSLFSLITYRRP